MVCGLQGRHEDRACVLSHTEAQVQGKARRNASSTCSTAAPSTSYVLSSYGMRQQLLVRTESLLGRPLGRCVRAAAPRVGFRKCAGIQLVWCPMDVFVALEWLSLYMHGACG